jgi:hypothetical protein
VPGRLTVLPLCDWDHKLWEVSFEVILVWVCVDSNHKEMQLLQLWNVTVVCHSVFVRCDL